jgi:hypothetical protein
MKKLAVCHSLIIIILFFSPFTGTGQRSAKILEFERQLLSLYDTLKRAGTDSLKLAINSYFSIEMVNALMLPEAEDYPFDSLKSIVKVASPDRKFRILHWNIPLSDGSQRYFGYLRMTGGQFPLIYPLHDLSDSLPYPDTATLVSPGWFGALYYQVICGKSSSGEAIYTLLGWSGKSPSVTCKVIDVLSFDEGGKPRFGMKIFRGYHDGNLTRIIFRYSGSATMSLKYEKQRVESQGRWNKGKRSFDRSASEVMMIVCEKVVPLQPELEGQYEYYIPSGDLSDGFLFKEGAWLFITGLDPVNMK